MTEFQAAVIIAILVTTVALGALILFLYRRLSKSVSNAARLSELRAVEAASRAADLNAANERLFGSLSDFRGSVLGRLSSMEEEVSERLGRADQLIQTVDRLVRSIKELEDHVQAWAQRIEATEKAAAAASKEASTEFKRRLFAITSELNAEKARSDMLRVELKKQHGFRREAEQTISYLNMRIPEEDKPAETKSD